MDITLNNCERLAEETVLKKAKEFSMAGKVLSVKKVDINEYVGVLYEGIIKIGRTKHTLCFAINNQDKIIFDKCFCNLVEGVLCEHYLAIFLFMKNHTNQIEVGKNIYNPVRVIFASVENNPQSVSLAVDMVFERFLRGNKISEWYMFCAIEGIVFSCMCAESEDKNLLERIELYCVVFEKLDKLFSLSEKPYPRILTNHAKSIFQFVNLLLQENLPKESLIVVKPIYFALYETAQKASKWQIKYNIWALLVQFCETPSLRIDFQKKMRGKISNQDNLEKKSDLRVLYCMILKSYNIKVASKYIEANIKDTSFRRMAIDLSIANGKYSEAKILAKEGLKIDKGNEKYTRLWTELMFDISQGNKDIKDMKLYAKELMLRGDFDYYLEYKKLFDEQEWQEIRQNLLNEICERYDLKELYLQIILDENLQPRLLEFCKNNPEKTATLFPYFSANYYPTLQVLLQTYSEKVLDNEELRLIKVVLKKLSKAKEQQLD